MGTVSVSSKALKEVADAHEKPGENEDRREMEWYDLNVALWHRRKDNWAVG